MNRMAIALAAVVVIVLVAGTLVTFGIGSILSDDEPREYTVEGRVGDLEVTGSVVCEDTGESGIENVLRFTYRLTYGGETHVSESYLIVGGDGMPNGDLNTFVGQRFVNGETVDVWQADAHPGYAFCLSTDNSIVAIVITIDGDELVAL